MGHRNVLVAQVKKGVILWLEGRGFDFERSVSWKQDTEPQIAHVVWMISAINS